MYICKKIGKIGKIGKISIISLIGVIILTIILLVVSYFLFDQSGSNVLYLKNERITNNYADIISRTLRFTTSNIVFGREFMSRYDIYNSTIIDYNALSGVNDSSAQEFVYSLNLYYNVSSTERFEYEKRLSTLTNSNISFVEFTNDNKNITTSINRDWYCPAFFVAPLNNTLPSSSYIPGFDICSVNTFRKQLEKLVKFENYELIIMPRKGILRNVTFLDFSEKTPNGLVVMSILINNITSLLVNKEHYIKLVKADVVFYSNCIDCYTDNYFSSKIILPNNEYIVLTVYYPYLPKGINTSFLYILISIIFVDVLVLFLIFNFEVDKNKYVIANTMLGYVNHEIRNPLNCINGLVEITLAQLESGEIQLALPEIISNLGTAKRACDMLTHIVNDILDLKKINDGKLIINKENVDMENFIYNLRKIINPKLSEKLNLVLIYENPDNITNLNTDYQRLLQILLNLLTNSIKFTNHGKIILKIEKNDLNNVKISVKDTGRGIDKKYYNNIFQPFEQINLTDNLRQGGIGLGLYLCKLIMSALDGTIGFESEVHVGSTFWIILNNSIITPHLTDGNEILPQ